MCNSSPQNESEAKLEEVVAKNFPATDESQ